MNNLPKKSIQNKLSFLVLLLLFFSFFLGFSVSNIKAQVPDPYVSCEGTRDPEFHTLRPYQSSPCDQEVSETALFCGNSLVLQEKVSSNEGSCITNASGQLECTVTKSRQIAIDLSGAELPIVGNTDDVINSQNSENDLEDGEKVNEYVSWYLNGVASPAEYGYLDPEQEEGISKIIDFSGPINKLLPRRILDNAREATVQQAYETRHNQIIGCVTAFGEIVPCSESGANPVRLTDFRRHLPPKEEEFDTFREYWIAYKRWRGESCLTLPIFGISVCADNPLKPNYWGNLYSQIPLSSTEDRVGLVETETVGVQPVSEGVEITNVSFSNQEPAELFFAHLEETTELARMLQQTFVSQDGEIDNLSTTGVSPSESADCDLTEIRTNPGDDLFAGEIAGTLTYTARFTCGSASNACEESGGRCYYVPSCSSVDQVLVNGGFGCLGNLTCCSGGQTCSKDISINLSLITETPKADNLWARTVAGASAIFKRIFPKVEAGSAIEGLWDMPAATKVTYSGEGVVAGNPGNERSGESAELYFPHLGGVSEYFLKGIQTILRPKGFGEQILSGQPGTGATKKECDQNVPDSAIPSKYLGAFKENYLRMASGWPEKSDCKGLDNTLADECYNDVVKRSVDKGVNPAFTLTIWLNETGASNYCESGSTAQDFGIRISSIFQNFGAQLDAFLALPFSGTYNACSNQAGWENRMHAFLSRFRSGGCDPSNTDGNTYYNAIRTRTWPWVSNCSSLPSWPTDTSCP